MSKLRAASASITGGFAMTPARIVAIDTHAPFIARLNQTARQLGLADRVQGRVGDMAAPGVAPGSVDLHLGRGLHLQRWLRTWARLVPAAAESGNTRTGTATCSSSCARSSPWCKSRRHSADAASRPAALLLPRILPDILVVAPCRAGAPSPSVRRRNLHHGLLAPSLRRGGRRPDASTSRSGAAAVRVAVDYLILGGPLDDACSRGRCRPATRRTGARRCSRSTSTRAPIQALARAGSAPPGRGRGLARRGPASYPPRRGARAGCQGSARRAPRLPRRFR